MVGRGEVSLEAVWRTIAPGREGPSTKDLGWKSVYEEVREGRELGYKVGEEPGTQVGQIPPSPFFFGSRIFIRPQTHPFSYLCCVWLLSPPKTRVKYLHIVLIARKAENTHFTDCLQKSLLESGSHVVKFWLFIYLN